MIRNIATPSIRSGMPARLRHRALASAMVSMVGTATWAQSTPPANDDASIRNPAGQASVPPARAPEATLPTVEISARRLNEARSSIQTQTGASTYSFDSSAIQALPGGDNSLLNQVVLQAPDVAQDSFGQYHVRGEHNGLQYRLNGVILPEGMSGFGQIFDPRLIESLSLITGALPAEFGLRTAGIIDLKTKDGSDTGGSVSIYGGSHDTRQVSAEIAAGSSGHHYFAAADDLNNHLGIESPDGSRNPVHDASHQTHLFALGDNVLDASNRISIGVGSSNGRFQIPNQADLAPALGLSVNGQTLFDSATLDERQQEATDFGFVSWQTKVDALDVQTSFTTRYSNLRFSPDPLGDLLFNGISQQADKFDLAYALQTDAAWHIDAAHTVRFGIFAQRDRASSETTSIVLPLNASGQVLDETENIILNGSALEHLGSVYLQDEWQVTAPLVFNYGLRYDTYRGYSAGHQVSPRLNLVWTPARGSTAHLGFARYFSPPPFELVGSTSVAAFAGTTAAAAVQADNTPVAERAGYTDFGWDQKLAEHWNANLDLYAKRSHHLIDEGQFGAPIILTPFNYAIGRQEGADLSLNYADRRLSGYINFSVQSAKGRRIETSQFNFSAADLAVIAGRDTDLDHEQRLSGSAGLTYHLAGLRLSTDLLYGSGLRADRTLPDGSTVPNGAHLPYYTQVNLGVARDIDLGGGGPLTLRIDVINLFDKIYEIRNGTGVGVGAPQFGPRRGVFAGLSKSF